jgi:hypothetical protein
MELGYMVYFLVIGLGGILLLGLAIYFGWEIVTHERRPSWSHRTRRAKVTITLAGLVFAWLLFIPLRMIWITRFSAVPGSYASEGVWGAATLTMRLDGSFVESWRLTNAYDGKGAGEGVTQGTWRDAGRDWLTRDIDLEPFKGLAEYSRSRVPSIARVSVRGYGGITSIEVDAGADIVFWK